MSDDPEETTALKGFIGTLFPFDRDGVAKKTAKKRGKTAEAVITE